jgi:hypothetical protein
MYSKKPFFPRLANIYNNKNWMFPNFKYYRGLID